MLILLIAEPIIFLVNVHVLTGEAIQL